MASDGSHAQTTPTHRTNRGAELTSQWSRDRMFKKQWRRNTGKCKQQKAHSNRITAISVTFLSDNSSQSYEKTNTQAPKSHYRFSIINTSHLCRFRKKIRIYSGVFRLKYPSPASTLCVPNIPPVLLSLEGSGGELSELWVIICSTRSGF